MKTKQIQRVKNGSNISIWFFSLAWVLPKKHGNRWRLYERVMGWSPGYSNIISVHKLIWYHYFFLSFSGIAVNIHANAVFFPALPSCRWQHRQRLCLWTRLLRALSLHDRGHAAHSHHGGRVSLTALLSAADPPDHQRAAAACQEAHR